MWQIVNILVFVTVLMPGAALELYLETFRSGMWKVPEDTFHNLTMSLRFNTSNSVQQEITNPTEAILRVKVVPDVPWKLTFEESEVEFTAEEVHEEVNKTLTFSGYYWGITKLTFLMNRNDLDPDFYNTTLLRDDLMITIDRKNQYTDFVFIAVGSVFILLNTINMGAQLDLEVIKKALKKPLGPLCGFLSQFICMPLLTFVMGYYFFSDPLNRLGLFTLGCSPGGNSSNFWTLIFNGDINLSITMTIISTVAAMGMMPMWMFTLGEQILKDADIQIPFVNLAISLISLTVPVSIGILIRFKRPQWADKGRKVLKPFCFLTLLFFMCVGTFNSYKVMLMMTKQMAIASFLVVGLGYTLGALFAKLMCLKKEQVIAVSIETAFQNAGVAFILLKLSLESPYSDLATVPIMATMLLTAPPLVLIYCCYLVLRRFCGCCPTTSLSDQNDEKIDLEKGRKEFQEKEGRTKDLPGEMVKMIQDADNEGVQINKEIINKT